MLAEQSLLVAIPQVQTVQQQIQDRLRKLPRSSGQKLQQIPAAPDRMCQTGLVKGLLKPVPGPGSVMPQKASVIGPQYRRRFGKAAMRLDQVYRDRFVADHPAILQLAADAPTRVVQSIEGTVPQRGRQLIVGGCGQVAQPLQRPADPAAAVAVGMPVTRHPPHRPVLALLTHTVPTSDAWAPSRSVDQGCSVLPFFAACRTRFSPLGSLPRLDVRHELGSRVLLGQRPSLHSLLRPSPAFVRLLRRYYAAVRLPATVHLGLIAHRLRPAVRVRLPTDGNGVSRFSRVEFLCMHGVSDSAGRGALALSHAVMLSSGYGDTVDSLIRRFRSSQLRDTQPTYAPSQRFRNALAGRPAWFGVKMVATPFLYGSFIHYSTPVYPDANHRVNPGKQRAQPSHQTGSGAFIGHVRWLHPAGYRQSQCVHQNVAFAPFDALVSVETAHAAALGGLYRLTIHDHHAWARFPPGGYTSLLI